MKKPIVLFVLAAMIINLFAVSVVATGNKEENYDFFDEEICSSSGGAFIDNGGNLWWSTGYEYVYDHTQEKYNIEYYREPKKIMTDVKTVSSDGTYVAAVRYDGSLWLRGGFYGPNYGGKKSERPVNSWRRIMEDVSTVNVTRGVVCVVKNNGELYVLGEGENNTPQKVMENVRYACSDSLSDYEYYCIITKNDDLYISGLSLKLCKSQFGEISNIQIVAEGENEPIKVMQGVKTIACGIIGTMAMLMNNGDLYTNEHSFNIYGALLNAGVLKKTKSNVRKVCVGGAHFLAITEAGDLYSWGWNNYGQVGIGSKQYDYYSCPQYIMSGIIDFSALTYCSFAVKENGDVLWCGSGSYFEEPHQYDFTELEKVKVRNFGKLPTEIEVGDSIPQIDSSQIPLIGNSIDLGFSLSDFKITFSEDENGGIVGTFGVNLAKLEDEHDGSLKRTESNFKKGGVVKACNEIKDAYEKIKKSGNDKIRKQIFDNLNKELNDSITSSPNCKVGVSVGLSCVGFLRFEVGNDGLELKDSGVILFADSGVQYTGLFAVTAVPIPLYWEAAISGQLASRLGVELDKNKGEYGEFRFNGSLEGEFAIEVGIGAGVPGIVSVGGGGTGALYPEYIFNTKEFTLDYMLGWYYKATIGVMEAKGVFPVKKGALYPISGNNHKINPLSEICDSENYELQSRKYLENPTEFCANSISLFSANINNSDYKLIKRNTYTNSDPQIVKLNDGRTMLLWLDDNAGRRDINRTCIYYSLFEDGMWSEPQILQDDGTADYMPKMKRIENDVFVVWQNMKKELNNDSDFSEMAENSEICVARFDGAENEFAEIWGITDDYLCDYMPEITGNEKEMYIAWVRNSENDFFGQAEEYCIMESVYQNGKWSSPEAAVSDLCSVDSISVGFDEKNRFTIVYCADTDGNITTSGDKIVYTYADGESAAITGEYVWGATKPYLADNGKIYYYSNQQIREGSGNYRSTLIADNIYSDRFKVFTNDNGDVAIVYRKGEGYYSELYAVLYDNEGEQWGRSVKLTDVGGYIEEFSGYLENNGQLIFAFNSRAVCEGDLLEPFGQADMYVFGISPEAELEVLEGIYADMNYLVPGNDLKIAIPVRNNGQKNIYRYLVTIKDDNNRIIFEEIYSKTILSGDETDIFVEYHVPEALSPMDFEITLKPLDCVDIDLSNNRGILHIDYNDIAIKKLSYTPIGSNRYKITATVANYGLTDMDNVNVCFYSNYEKNMLAEKRIPVIKSCDSEEISIIYEKPAESGMSSIAVFVTELENEDSVSNNSFNIVIMAEPYDMCVPQINIVSVNENIYTIETISKATCFGEENGMGCLVTAIYDSNERLIGIREDTVSFEKSTFIHTFDIDSRKTECISVKCFLWNELEGMKPLVTDTEAVFSLSVE